MNTHETYVSLEVAKLLKKSGFDWKINSAYWMSAGKFELVITDDYDDWNCRHDIVSNSAPTLAVAQKWLREVKDYYCFIEYDGLHRTYQCRIDSYVHIYDIKHREWINNYEEFSTYEEALEAGIKKCLEIILENDDK